MPDKRDESSGSLGRAAARGTAYGFLLRIISFTLSQLTLRFVDPVALGRASIRLELLLNTALFLGREGFRLALIRTDSESITQSKLDAKVTTDQVLETNLPSSNITINNVSWLSIPVGAFLSLVAFFAHMYSCTYMKKSTFNDSMFDDNSEQDYKIAGVLYCLAAFIESLAEPLVIKSMQQLDVESRAAAEGSAALAKAMTSVLLLNGSNPAFIPAKLNFASKWPVTAFGMAQLIHSFVLSYILYNRKWKSIEWPSFSLTFSIKQNFDIATLKLTTMFTLQGIFKHLLTEGDRIVLTALADGYDQGVYAMASSYGGMASRLLLQPLEENARLLFAKQEKIYVAQIQKISTKDKNGTNTDHDGNHIKTSELERTLCVILKLVLYIGLLFSCVATNYTNLLLTILAGNRWVNNSDASDALSAFCCYTALLSLNGTTEAFVYGVAKSGTDVGRLGLVHFLVGIIFASTAPLFVSYWGTVGLVAANGVGMAVRSTYSIHYASSYFYKHEHILSSRGSDQRVSNVALRLIRQFSPHPVVILCFLGTYVMTNLSLRMMYNEIYHGENIVNRFSKLWFISAFKHVGVGISCLILTIILSFRYENNFGKDVRIMLREKRD